MLMCDALNYHWHNFCFYYKNYANDKLRLAAMVENQYQLNNKGEDTNGKEM
jgi:hypothetical protein